MKTKLGTVCLVGLVLVGNNIVLAEQHRTNQESLEIVDVNTNVETTLPNLDKPKDDTNDEVNGTETDKDNNVEDVKELSSNEVKELYKIRIGKNINSSEGLNLLKEEIKSDKRLTKSDFEEVIKLISTKIKNLEKQENEKKPPFTEAELKSKTKVNHNGKNFVISLPNLNNKQNYSYKVLDKDKKEITSGTSSNITLSKLTKETTLSLKVDILEGNNTLLSTSFPIEIIDITTPELKYAYIDNGEVILKFKEDYVLNKEINAIIDGKRITINVKNNSFETDVRGNIELITVSALGKEKSINLNIKKDNHVIFGIVDSNILEKLEKNQLMDLEQYKSIRNLFVGYKDKKIDLKKETEELVSNLFGKVNKEDISFISKDMEINGSIGSMVKPGLNVVEIKHSFYKNEDLKFYVYVREEGRIHHTNIKKLELKGNLTTNKESIYPKDFIWIDKIMDGYEPVLDFTFLIDDNFAYSLDEKIELKKNKINSFKIIDVLRGDELTLDLMYREDFKPSAIISFTDVKGSDWAYNDIKDLAFSGLVRGYEDGSFKPDNNITKKEFMVLLNRFSDQVGLGVNNFKNNDNIKLVNDDWGYIDVLSICRKIDKKDLGKVNINDLNKEITRGEVAFLVDNSLNLKELGESRTFKDINNSKHKEHINNLVNAGVLYGYNDGTFKPNNNITRAEVSSILNKLLQLNSEGNQKLEPELELKENELIEK